MALTHLDLAISPIMHAKKPRRSPLRLCFLTYLLEEISYAICITYFPTIPKVRKRFSRMVIRDFYLLHSILVEAVTKMDTFLFLANACLADDRCIYKKYIFHPMW
jgi:hypothetical protein